MLRVVFICTMAVLVQSCGLAPGDEEAIPSSELVESDIHRSYTAVYNEGLETTEYTAEFSKRDSFARVYLNGGSKVTVNGNTLLPVNGAKSGLYTLRRDEGYMAEEITFRWTNHSDAMLPDTFAGPLELTPDVSGASFRRGQDLVIRLEGPREIPDEETLVGVLVSSSGEQIFTEDVNYKRARFAANTLGKLNNTGWVFYVDRMREIERKEVTSSGLVGTAAFLSLIHI